MRMRWLVASMAILVVATAEAQIHVQDIARLQGQRTNKLMGYGLVVGLNGTGDGDQYAPTMRALMRLHQRFHAPVLSVEDIEGNQSVALVAVEATLPEFGAREGQTVDVTVSAVGSAQSLAGGQLLTTPLQYAMFDENDPSTQVILALAGGGITLPRDEVPTRGLIRQGATLEQDFFYHFIQDGAITLVLDDAHAGWTWAHMTARALNHELSNPAAQLLAEKDEQEAVQRDWAVALGPKNVQVQIPPWELSNPANYISRVLQTPLFMLPQQQAVVTINHATKHVSFTGNVTISPTVLQIPGLGTVLIGKQVETQDGQKGQPAPVSAVEFGELLNTLASVKASPDQLIHAIETLQRSGSLHAQVRYE